MVSRDCHNVNNKKKVSPYSTVSRKAVVLLECWQSQHIDFRNGTRQDDTRVVSKSKIDTSDATAAYEFIVFYLHLKKVIG